MGAARTAYSAPAAAPQPQVATEESRDVSKAAVSQETAKPQSASGADRDDRRGKTRRALADMYKSAPLPTLPQMSQNRAANWLAYSRVTLSAPGARTTGQAVLAVEVPWQNEELRLGGRAPTRQTVGRAVQVAIQPISPPGAPSGAKARGLAGMELQRNNLEVLPDSGSSGRVAISLALPPRDAAYEITVTSEDGQSRSLLLFTAAPRSSVAVQSLRGHPFDLLCRLSSQAGVWLLTPPDLGGAPVASQAGSSADSLAALLRSMGMNLRRDGSFWTATR